MIVSLLFLAVLVVLLLVFVWLGVRAWRLHSPVLRILAGLLSGLLTLVLLAITVVMARGAYIVFTPHRTAVPNLTVQPTPERLARGEHLVTVVCAACHSKTGQPPLVGGANLADDFHLPLGDLYPANLTPAGRLPQWSDGEILRAMREGIGRDGVPLYGMPSRNLRNLSDEDAASVIAYLRSQPPAGQQVPPLAVSPLGVLLVGAGVGSVGSPPVAGPVVAPPVGPTAAYGEYIVSYSDCRECHGADLRGGKPPAPVGPTLHLVTAWSREGFIQALRTGIDPGGHQIQPPMPWKQLATLDDTELTALYEYLKTVPN